MYPYVYGLGVSYGEALHTQTNTKEHRGCQKGPESGALVLLYRCSTASFVVVGTVAARLLLKSPSAKLYRPAPTAQHPMNCISLELLCSFLFPTSTGNMTQTLTRTHAPSAAVTRGDELDV